MSFRTVVAAVSKVQCSDGKIVPCNYLQHPRFSLTCGFCAGLHYVFVRYGSDVSFARVYSLRTAINLLLNFIVDFEIRNPKPLHLTELSQFGVELFRGFDFFIKKNGGPLDSASRLKTAIKMVGQRHDEGMPLLTLPVLDQPRSVPNEPLTESCFNELETSLRTHIVKLYEKLEFRKVVEAATPYTIEEVNAIASIQKWIPNFERCLRTLSLHGHPFSVSISEAIDAPKRDFKIDVLAAIYGAFRVSPRDYGIERPFFDELLSKYYPSAMDQTAICLFLMLQTGWNKETVTAIDGENFKHILTGAFDTNTVLIVSEKNKSQGNGKPFSAPKTFFAPSNKADKFSAYSLVKLAKSLSLPLSGLPLECDAKQHRDNFNPLFICIRGYRTMFVNDKGVRSGRFLSIGSKYPWESGIADFLKRYPIFENGKRLETAGELTDRLRPTWIRFHRDKLDKPLSLVALQQGHASIETTDVHYDNSGVARQGRRERLREELEIVVQALRERRFKGMLGRRSDASIDMSTWRIFTIPGHERALWGCSDSLRPDWPGAAHRVPEGQRCTEISQCLFCSRVGIFEDSLPYLMSRESRIQVELTDYQEPELDAPLQDELKIIEYILEVWGDERALKLAARYLRAHPNLLPASMRELSTLVED